jgi:Protein of unknown function (DUF664)
LVAGERAALSGWLDYHRITLALKCEGLSGEQLAQRSIPPSELSLLGIVRHMTGVEWWWFAHVFAADPQPSPLPDDPDDPDADFHLLVPEEAGAALSAWARQCEHSRTIAAAAASLDVLTRSTERRPRDLRWVMVHMIEEYARHNGHADLLRECLDGTVGD